MNRPKKIRLSKYSKRRLRLILSGLKAAKPYLYTEKEYGTFYPNKHVHICSAINAANIKDKIDREAAYAATEFIMDLLYPYAHCVSYLFSIGRHPSNKETQRLRHAWLDALVKQLKDYLEG